MFKLLKSLVLSSALGDFNKPKFIGPRLKGPIGEFAISMPQKMPAPKVLIIRFSSFGDVTQALSIPAVIHRNLPEAEIHWVVRQDLSELLEGHPDITKIWSLQRQLGLKGLWQLAIELRQQNFNYIYDAHNNLRSIFLCWVIRFFKDSNFVRKSQFRWKRFLLFKLRINTYQMPFSGQRDLLNPLLAWKFDVALPPAPQLFITQAPQTIIGEYIALAPSAAHALKRWPLDYWKQLIQLMPSFQFKVLGGPGESFLEELKTVAPDRVEVLAGKLSLQQSAAVVQTARLLIANDTGLLHIAEQIGTPAIALMGPAPFGYPSRASTEIMELTLACKPCSKHGQGPCINPDFQLCLRGISPHMVKQKALGKMRPL